MAYVYHTGVTLGPGRAGLVTGNPVTAIGYRLYGPTGSVVQGHTTTGVYETTTPGNYDVQNGISLPDGFSGTIRWFQGSAATASLVDEWVDVSALPTAEQIAIQILDHVLTGRNVADSVGNALHLARAFAAGKKVGDKTANTLKIYDLDGTTLLATLNLSPSGGPYTQVAP